jgi:hypothetical protein
MSSSGSSGTDWISKLEALRSGNGGVFGGGFSNTIEKLLLLPVVAFFLQLANALEAILNLLIVPTNTLISGIGEFLGSLFGGIAQVISAGAAGTAQNVQQWFTLSLPVAVGVVLLIAMMVAWYTDQDYTSDLVPFSSTDFWFIGNDEED